MTEHDPNPADKVYGFGNDSTMNRMRYLAGVADALGSVRLSAPFFKQVLELLDYLDRHHTIAKRDVERLEAKVKKLREEGKR